MSAAAGSAEQLRGVSTFGALVADADAGFAARVTRTPPPLSNPGFVRFHAGRAVGGPRSRPHPPHHLSLLDRQPAARSGGPSVGR